jgi:PAS domain S-box-containing protein
MATRNPNLDPYTSSADTSSPDTFHKGLFAGTGEMRARLRQFDWASTSLGPVADWPLGLRLQVRNCLNTHFPMCIWWGPDLCMIYNDAYAPIFGKRHPDALGCSARVIWSDAWSAVDLQVKAVLEHGEPSWQDRALIQSERNGVREDSWFTFSLSPLFSESGSVEGILLISIEETKAVLRERELVETHDRLAATLSTAEVGSWSLDALTGKAFADASLARKFSISPEVAAAGAPLKVFTDAIHVDDRGRTIAAITDAMATKDTFDAEYRLNPQNGLVRWVIGRGRVIRNANGQPISMSGVLIDITERKRSEQLVAAQNEVLQLVASETSLPKILTFLVQQVEAQGNGGTVASILLVDQAGRLRHGAATSLPDAYNMAVDGIAIGENVGTCGRAAFLREVVITPDLANDPNWALLKSEALKLGLVAAWSMPIVSTSGKILGTFGTYFREQRAPTLEEKMAVNFFSKTAAIAIERAQAKEVLEESEQRFRTLADNISQFAWTADGTGALTWYNQRWFDYTGTTFEAMQGWGWQQVHHPDHVGRVTEKFASHVKEGIAWEDTFPLKGKDGNYRWFLSRAFPIRNAAGEVERWFGTNTDITAMREVQEELRQRDERFRQVADTLPQIVWGAGPDGVLDYYNHRWFEYINLPDTDLEAARWDKFIHPEDLPATHETWTAALAAGENYQAEFRVRRADGDYRWFLTRALPVRDEQGRIVRWFGTCTDINDRRMMQDENLQMIERERAARLASETAGRMKDDFLATLSHELRTPLNPVLLLASDAAANKNLPDHVRADFETIAKNIALEARLIDDLLDLTRITKGKMALTMAPTDLHAVLQDALEIIASDVKAGEIILVTKLTALNANVIGDAVRLQQVFWNILRNAVKFTPKGGSINVSTSLTVEDEHIEIRIADSGMGMSTEEVGRLFNAFVQGDHAGNSGSHRFGGLGLGLAISRMLVELHSGRISGASEGAGKGAIFTVQIPLAKPSQTRKPSDTEMQMMKPAVNKNSRPTRILLVEDHEPTRRSLAQLLIRRHYEITEAGSVLEALAAANRQKFDLLITDIGLPDGDGYQLMRTLLQSSDVKGIALTGYGMESDIEKSRQAGFATHLTKPIRIQALDAALASAAAVASKS